MIALKYVGRAALGLLALTAAHAVGERANAPQPPSPRQAADAREAAAGPERCRLFHARFGGRRAQLLRVNTGGVRTYLVIEVGKRDPAMRRVRSAWLRAAYGEAGHVWLGEFASAEAAMLRAALYCPAAQRCWPGESACAPQAEAATPAQIFLGLWPPASAAGL
jgi:hypothetical protein